MNQPVFPVLYSFRRCPYAMRARMALQYANIRYELREVVLRDKPQAMLKASPKGTVPVLVLPDQTIIDESLDIMFWAVTQLKQNTQTIPDLIHLASIDYNFMMGLIHQSDTEFKPLLDRYKYPNRFSDQPQGMEARNQACDVWLMKLEDRLTRMPYLMGDKLTLTDIALFPFLRQFANTDRGWFDKAPYPNLQQWLTSLIESSLFQTIMQKYSPWNSAQAPVII